MQIMTCLIFTYLKTDFMLICKRLKMSARPQGCAYIIKRKFIYLQALSVAVV